MQPTELTAESEIWERFNSVPRILTDEYIRSIPWEQLGECPSEDFAKALMIASDVETATYDVFFLQELSTTVSNRDPIISAFMQRWVREELTHGELLRGILSRWGYDYRYVTPRLALHTRLVEKAIRFVGSFFGEQFKAMHMMWGGIQELTARETYRRLRDSTTDPVVRLILSAIIKEESLHANFYLGMTGAKIGSRLTRALCRLTFRKWRPLGAWNKTKAELKPLLGLFAGANLENFDRNVTREFERRLPAFAGSGLTLVLEKTIRAARI